MMQERQQKHPEHYPQVIDERRTTQTADAFWHVLTMAQKCELSKLLHFGYQLCFVRKIDDKRDLHLAIAKSGNALAAIYPDGDFELAPKLKLRL